MLICSDLAGRVGRPEGSAVRNQGVLAIGRCKAAGRNRRSEFLLLFLGFLAALVLTAAQFTSHFELISRTGGSTRVHHGRDLKIRIITEAAFSNRAYSIFLQRQEGVSVRVLFDARDKVISVRPQTPLNFPPDMHFAPRIRTRVPVSSDISTNGSEIAVARLLKRRLPTRWERPTTVPNC